MSDSQQPPRPSSGGKEPGLGGVAGEDLPPRDDQAAALQGGSVGDKKGDFEKGGGKYGGGMYGKGGKAGKGGPEGKGKFA